MIRFVIHLLPLLVALCVCHESRGCTSAIVSASRSASGCPLLWKNRDTSNTDNKVAYVAPSEPGELAYVALFNASDRDLREAWIGMNSAGFAVMNTASYNLNADAVPAADMDREGLVMALALKHCRSVDDFQILLEGLPRPLGVEANFGVIDAAGNGAFFETGNYSFTRFDLCDEPSGVLVRTNYSHSGRPGEGFGQIREKNALTLLAPHLADASITPELLTDGLSCSFYHSLHGIDMLSTGSEWIVDQDFIPRYTTTATVVIEGVPPLDEPAADCGLAYVMWTALGYPPCAEVLPVWCNPKGVDPELQGLEPGGTSAMGNRARARRDEVFSAPDGNRSRYVHVPVLLNEPGGYLRHFRRLNHQTYERLRRR